MQDARYRMQGAGARCRMQDTGCRVQAHDAGCRSENFELRSADCEFKKRIQEPGVRSQEKTEDPGCRRKMQDSRCRMQDAGFKMQDAGFKMQDAGYMVLAHDAGSSIQGAGAGCMKKGQKDGEGKEL